MVNGELAQKHKIISDNTLDWLKNNPTHQFSDTEIKSLNEALKGNKEVLAEIKKNEPLAIVYNLLKANRNKNGEYVMTKETINEFKRRIIKFEPMVIKVPRKEIEFEPKIIIAEKPSKTVKELDAIIAWAKELKKELEKEEDENKIKKYAQLFEEMKNNYPELFKRGTNPEEVLEKIGQTGEEEKKEEKKKKKKSAEK